LLLLLLPPLLLLLMMMMMLLLLRRRLLLLLLLLLRAEPYCRAAGAWKPVGRLDEGERRTGQAARDGAQRPKTVCQQGRGAMRASAGDPLRKSPSATR